MSDKEAVKVLIAHRIRFMDDFGWDKSTIEALDIAIASLATESEPTVLQEISAREYHNIAKRMLDTDMGAFKLWWDMMRWLDDKALAFAEKWVREHPEET